MTLEQIETIVLQMVGYDRYADLSVDTETKKIADFALLHQCVHMARHEIARNVKMFGNIVWDNIAVTKGLGTYDAPGDFDLPILMVWIGSGGSTYNLKQVYAENLIQKLGKPFSLLSEGMPEWYAIIGQDTDLIQIALAPIPNEAGSIGMTYYPILPNVTVSTDETVDMKKYPETITKLASAYFFQLMKKDAANFDKYYTLGFADISMIRQRESAADSNMTELPSEHLRNKRTSRHTV